MRGTEFERLRDVLSAAEEPMTAREILRELEREDREALESPHRVATVLGRQAREGEVEVVGESPYRYRLAN